MKLPRVDRFSKGQSCCFFNLQIELSLSLICTLLQEKRRKKKKKGQQCFLLPLPLSVVTIIILIILVLLCVTRVFPCHQIFGPSLTERYSWNLLTCTKISLCAWYLLTCTKISLYAWNLLTCTKISLCAWYLLTCTKISPCAWNLLTCTKISQEGKTGTDEPAQVLTMNWKMVLHPILNGSQTHSGPPAQHFKPLSYNPCWPFVLSFNVIKTILNKWFPFKSIFFLLFIRYTFGRHFSLIIQINNQLLCLISRHLKCTVPIFSWLTWKSNSCLWICKGAHRFLACESVKELTGLADLHYIVNPHWTAPFLSSAPQLKMQHQHLRKIHFALIKPSWLTGHKKANYLHVNHYTNCSENEHNLQLLSQFNRPFSQATNKHQTLTLVTAKQTLG